MMLGKSLSNSAALEAAIASAAISVSKTSAWLPRPSLAVSISLPMRYAAVPAPTRKNPNLFILEPSV